MQDIICLDCPAFNGKGLWDQVRDQRDSWLWDQLPEEKRAMHVERIAIAAAGSLPYKLLVWASVLISISLSMVWLWAGPEYDPHTPAARTREGAMQGKRKRVGGTFW